MRSNLSSHHSHCTFRIGFYGKMKRGKLNKLIKRLKKAVFKSFLPKRMTKKLVAVGLLGMVNLFHLAVAAAPTTPPLLVPQTATAETLTQVSSLSAQSPLEAGYQTITVDLTGYSSTPDQTDETPFITAANTKARDGVVASNFLAFGTKIRIPELFGDKIFTVEDRMHKRFDERLDIWFPNRKLAEDFGFKEKVAVQILTN